MKKWLLVLVVFVTASALALYNIAHFPKMVGDEGIYVSQAYWLTFLGKLGPYTYWYDHFPLGWLQIGLWERLASVATFFGSSVLSVRVFTGLALAGTATLLYSLTRQFTHSVKYGLIATTLFITSPLTLTFGRMVLLDNLAVFWLLLSLLLLVKDPQRIKYISFSALSMAVAVLTKESLLFYLPPYLLLVWTLNKDNFNRRYALMISLLTASFLLAFFPLLALLKGELVPHTGQVSLLGTIAFQASRGTGKFFWQVGSQFRTMLPIWLGIDPFLPILGVIATIWLCLPQTELKYKILSLFTPFFLVFLARGGQIYDFYVIPLLPLLALDITLAVKGLAQKTNLPAIPYLLLASLLTYNGATATYIFTTNATAPQLQSLVALKELPASSAIVAPEYVYLDTYLNNPKRTIEWYQKVESDQTVRSNMPPITHILVDEQFSRSLAGGELPYLQSLIPEKAKPQTFGRQLSPGEIVPPYTNEYLSLYYLGNDTIGSVKSVLTFDTNDPAFLTKLAASHPYAVLVTKENFQNSKDLQSLLQKLRSSLPHTLIITFQDGGTGNTIPWVLAPTREFFKSAGEAAAATQEKSKALADLGFTGAVITTATDTDSYLSAIVNAAQPYLTPVLHFTGVIVQSTAPIIVKSSEDVQTLKAANYPGDILLISSQK